MAENVSFQIAYVGPEYEQGTMNVRDLAPALLAVGDLLQLVARQKYGEEVEIRVDITALKKASFDIDLAVFFGNMVGLFGSDAIGALTNLLSIAGWAKNGLMNLIPLIGKRDLKEATIVQQINVENNYGNIVNITFPDGTVVKEVPEEVANLLQDNAARERAAAIVKPLQKNGVTSVKLIRSQPNETEEWVSEIQKDSLEAFESLPSGEEKKLTETEIVTWAQLVQPSFEGNYKWRIDLGNGPITADMKDEQFITRIKNGEEAFKATSILKVKMVETKYLTETGRLNAKHEIIEVLDHQPNPQSELEL